VRAKTALFSLPTLLEWNFPALKPHFIDHIIHFCCDKRKNIFFHLLPCLPRTSKTSLSASILFYRFHTFL
jgi:hypothetical protein